MGTIEWFQSMLSYDGPDSTVSSEGSESQSRKTSNSTAFWDNITWECSECGNEFYWMDDDDALTCHYCETTYGLRPDSTPEALRAKCFNCGYPGDGVGAWRAENASFTCERCGWHWESDPYWPRVTFVIRELSSCSPIRGG